MLQLLTRPKIVIKTILVSGLASIVLFAPSTALAVIPVSAGGGATPSAGVSSTNSSQSQSYYSGPSTDSDCNENTCDLIGKYVNPIINVLSVVFGLIAVISIIFGGIEYTASEGDPQKATKAKSRIAKVVFAMMAYFFLYAFLQFIVPGGAFNRSG